MILICAGSDGNNLKLATKLHEIAGEESIPTEVIDLGALELPMFTNARNKEDSPTGLGQLIKRFEEATGFIMVAPEYNGSIPPLMTNMLAWLSTKSDDFRILFNDKAVALATHSGGGGSKVMVSMRIQMSHLGCNVVGRELVTSHQKELNQDSAKAVLLSLSSMSS